MKSKYRFAIAQLNPTVGDYAGNCRKIIDWIRKAEKNKADVVVFPELALSGYPVWDLSNKKRFVDEGLRALERIQRATKSLKVSVFLGFIEPGTNKRGHSFNAMAWIEKGKVRGIQRKRLLPTYDVFLENIFFEAGRDSKIMTAKGLRLGPTICEDVWDDFYDIKPLESLKRKRAQFVINISSSPYFKNGGAQARCVAKEACDPLQASHPLCESSRRTG